MKKKLASGAAVIVALFSASLFADSVVFTPPGSGKVTVSTTSGKISGTFAGNVTHATSVIVALVVNGVAVNFTLPLGTGQAFTGQSNFTTATTADALTYQFTASANGINFSITLNGAAPLTGTF